MRQLDGRGECEARGVVPGLRRNRQPLRSCKLDWHVLRPISPKRNSRYKPLHREPASRPSSI
jgi:hypothetical protein